MNHSPLKTALAYECFQDQDNSTLALPSDQKMKTGTSGRQRVQEQVMMTVKRQKSKSSQSSTLSHSNRGSMYDGLADSYNNYGTSSRSSFYSKFQAGSGSWGYPIYNGTLKREADNRRFSSYSQMESWGRQYPRGGCTAPGAGSDICFMQKIKASRSEPDLYCDPRGTLRKGTLGGKGHKTTQNRYSFYSTCSGQKAVKKYPGRPPSCTSRQDPVCVPPTSCTKDLSFSHSRASSKICSEDIECSGLTIPKAVQYLSSQDEKCQAIGAYYIQHTCFQDESAKQQVYQLGGICKLVDLLRSPNQNVQQAAAGALRNLVFRSTTNKLETRRQNGIREAVSLLRRTGSTEIQKQLTGGGLAAGAGVGAAGGRDRVRAGGSLRQTPLESHRPVLARLVVPSWCPGYWAPLCAHRPSVWSEVSEERGQCVQVESVFGEAETGRRPQGVGALAQPPCPVDPHRSPSVLPSKSCRQLAETGQGAQGGVKRGGPEPGPAEPAVPRAALEPVLHRRAEGGADRRGAARAG
uniref:PKP1 protein n=1 Tax=Bos taurus TaxID=9913 RepID=A6QP21_BOVIN|nr:PKP1 protein [Bos taurus]